MNAFSYTMKYSDIFSDGGRDIKDFMNQQLGSSTRTRKQVEYKEMTQVIEI